MFIRTITNLSGQPHTLYSHDGRTRLSSEAALEAYEERMRRHAPLEAWNTTSLAHRRHKAKVSIEDIVAAETMEEFA